MSTTPSSSAMASVMILKVEPGSYVSEMALFLHWSCWAAAMSSARSASLDAAASISAMASPLIVW